MFIAFLSGRAWALSNLHSAALFLILATAFVVTSPSQTQAATTIDGMPVFCVALNGAPVQEMPQPYLGDAARATMMPTAMGMMPVILLDPTVLANFGPDRSARLFIYAHECGHHALGHILRGMTSFSEMQADCWGIKIGRDQGWFDIGSLQRMGIYFANNPGDPWGHLPGPARVANFARCFQDAMMASQYQQAIVNGLLPY